MLEYIKNMYNGVIFPTGFMKHYYTLYSIVEGLETKNSFEFGTGISTKIIINALRITEGKHISCDIRNVENTGLTKEYLIENSDIWTYIQGDSRNINFKAFDYFDFVLHDGSHVPYIVKEDLNNIFPYIKNSGIILIHDTILIHELESICKNLANQTNSEIVTLPYGYGLTILKVNNNNEKVHPTWKKF